MKMVNTIIQTQHGKMDRKIPRTKSMILDRKCRRHAADEFISSMQQQSNSLTSWSHSFHIKPTRRFISTTLCTATATPTTTNNSNSTSTTTLNSTLDIDNSKMRKTMSASVSSDNIASGNQVVPNRRYSLTRANNNHNNNEDNEDDESRELSTAFSRLMVTRRHSNSSLANASGTTSASMANMSCSINKMATVDEEESNSSSSSSGGMMPLTVTVTASSSSSNKENERLTRACKSPPPPAPTSLVKVKSSDNFLTKLSVFNNNNNNNNSAPPPPMSPNGFQIYPVFSSSPRAVVHCEMEKVRERINKLNGKSSAPPPPPPHPQPPSQPPPPPPPPMPQQLLRCRRTITSTLVSQSQSSDDTRFVSCSNSAATAYDSSNDMSASSSLFSNCLDESSLGSNISSATTNPANNNIDPSCVDVGDSTDAGDDDDDDDGIDDKASTSSSSFARQQQQQQQQLQKRQASGEQADQDRTLNDSFLLTDTFSSNSIEDKHCAPQPPPPVNENCNKHHHHRIGEQDEEEDDNVVFCDDDDNDDDYQDVW